MKIITEYNIMSEGKIEKCNVNNNFTYFSYFNHKLYDNPTYMEVEESDNKSDNNIQSIEESTNNTSLQSISSINKEDNFIPFNLLDLSPTKQSNSLIFKKEEKKIQNKSPIKEIMPELQKYILPKSLFDSNKNKKNQEEEIKKQEKETNKFNLSSSLSLPCSSLLTNQLNLYSEPFIPKYKFIPVIVVNNPSIFLNYNNKIFQKIDNYNKNKDYIHNERKKKKKNREFVEREGDWPCYQCKNINFAFRNKCNKCQMTKEESEKKFVEVGEELLKLADLSIYNKSKGNLD